MIKKLIVSVLLIFSIYSVTVKAEENRLLMNSGADMTMNYICCGYKLADLSIQPDISVDYSGNNIEVSCMEVR